MGDQSRRGATRAGFGQAATFNSDVGFDLAVSDDRKAFTATFSGLAVSLDPKPSAPVVARVFTFVLPLSGATPDTEIPFFVSGFVKSENGANGHLVFSINDQTTAVDFPGNVEKSFVHQVNFKAGAASEVRLTVFLSADRESTSQAMAALNVNAIDTDFAKHQS
jgi:hypothetical protein